MATSRLIYDKDVLCVTNKSKNVGLNATEKKVLAHLLKNSRATTDDMATSIGVTKRTIERTLNKLQEKGLLVRNGAKKSGSWVIFK